MTFSDFSRWLVSEVFPQARLDGHAYHLAVHLGDHDARKGADV